MSVSPLPTASELDSFRAAAEALMLDTCTVSDKTGRMAQNEGTGAEEAVYVARFSSKCKIQSSASLVVSDASVGGHRQAIDQLQIHLPVTVGQVAQGELITITATGAGSDPRLVGRKFIVGAPMSKSFATATRLSVKELP